MTQRSVILQNMIACFVLIHLGSCGSLNKPSSLIQPHLYINQQETLSAPEKSQKTKRSTIVQEVHTPQSNWTFQYARQIARLRCEAYGEHQYLPVPITPAPNIQHQNDGSISPGVIFEKKCDAFNVAVVPHVLEVAPRLYPHIARIGYSSEIFRVRWECSGSLISERFILSAASCGKTSKWGAPRWVSLGDSRENPDNYIGQQLIATEQYDIIKVYDHPQYDGLWWRNDISIFELSTKVTMNRYIRPACLLQSPINLRFGAGAIYATGYPRNSERLIRTTVDIHDASCSTLYNSKDQFYTEYDLSTMICTRNLNNNPSLESCMVESGGPLQIHVQKEGMECMFNVVGVMTTAKKCLDNDGVTIYTKVDQYIDWVQNIVWP